MTDRRDGSDRPPVGYVRSLIRANSAKPEGRGFNNHWYAFLLALAFTAGQFVLSVRYRDPLMAAVTVFLLISYFLFLEIGLYEVHGDHPQRTIRGTVAAVVGVLAVLALNLWLMCR